MKFRYASWAWLGAALAVPLGMRAQQAGVIVNYIPGCNFQTGELSASCIPRFIAHLVQMIFMLIGIFFLMNIMVGGYQIVLAATSGNDSSKGKNRLIYSFVGFLVAASSFAVMDAILTAVLG
jgi:hypothetical protein